MRGRGEGCEQGQGRGDKRSHYGCGGLAAGMGKAVEEAELMSKSIDVETLIIAGRSDEAWRIVRRELKRQKRRAFIIDNFPYICMAAVVMLYMVAMARGEVLNVTGGGT